MAVKGQVLDMTPLGMKFTVLQASADTAGKSLDLHWELLPGCNMHDPLIHTHPHATETYEVLEGEMEFFVKDRWVPAVAGDKLSVEPGVPHMFRNPSGKVVKVFNTHQPALQMEQYFEDICKIIDKVTHHRTRPFHFNLKSKLYLGVLLNRYRHEIIAKSPPDIVVRILGFIGRLLGLSF